MATPQVFRVAVFGSPQAERWLLVEAFSATRRRSFGYELTKLPAYGAPHMVVVDPSDERALARWSALDPKGRLPAAFFGRVHQRAKNAVIVARPLTSGLIVDALDQLVRRFYSASLEAADQPMPLAA